MDQEKLRKETKQLKEQTKINLNYIANQIGLKDSSFYNFLCGSKGLSEEKQELLKQELRRLK